MFKKYKIFKTQVITAQSASETGPILKYPKLIAEDSVEKSETFRFVFNTTDIEQRQKKECDSDPIKSKHLFLKTIERTTDNSREHPVQLHTAESPSMSFRY